MIYVDSAKALSAAWIAASASLWQGGHLVSRFERTLASREDWKSRKGFM